MTSDDIQPYEWIRRFFSNNNGFGNREFGNSDFFDMNLFRDFEEIQSQMRRMFEQVDKANSDTAPKELVKEYDAPDGSKVRQVGPIVYGYSMTIGKDGKPLIQEFGNVRPSKTGFGMNGGGGRTRPQLTDEREPLVDISTTNDQVIIVLEMPGAKKEDLKINASEDSIEVQSTDPKRKYHKIIELPKEVDIESAKSKFNNGILEVIFNKKEETKSKGKEIRID
jgi:HSP20 family protein